METVLIPLNRFNWENYLKIEISPQQQQFCPSVLYSLAQAYFENITAFGINFDEKPVGFITYANFSGIFWISRVMIDIRHQQKGIARAALVSLIDSLFRKAPNTEIRTSFSPENKAARNLFQSLGFEPINKEMKEEIVAVWNGKRTNFTKYYNNGGKTI